ncbi:class I SAM-dependent methyltransferase [Methylocaldum gracile]
MTARSHILDLGCGTGRPMAEYILNQGHKVTGIDQAFQLLDRARTRMPSGTWIESTIEGFETDDRFAGVVCWDALFHIPRERHPAILARIAKMLIPKGRLMLTVGGSKHQHPAFTDTMFGETFFYDSFPPEKVMSMLGELGFRPLVAEFMNEPSSGRDKGRYAIVAHIA